MTNRVDELWGDALDQTVPETWTTLNPAQLAKLKQKFAESIVNECCQQLLKEDIRYGGYGYNQYGLHNKLREHFGVEE